MQVKYSKTGDPNKKATYDVAGVTVTQDGAFFALIDKDGSVFVTGGKTVKVIKK